MRRKGHNDMAGTTLKAQVDALAAQVAALTAALTAAQGAPKAPRAKSPAQVTWETRTAGTCSACGRANFRTANGGRTHALTADGAPCNATPEQRAADFPA